MFSKILVGTDGSEEAEKAVTYAADLAQQSLGDVLVVHVTPRIHASLGGPADMYVAEESREEKDYAEKALSRAGEILEKRGVEFQTFRVVGRPARELVLLAEREECDLVVLGSKGRSAIGRMLLGSVVSEVAQLAHCPVIITR